MVNPQRLSELFNSLQGRWPGSPFDMGDGCSVEVDLEAALLQVAGECFDGITTARPGPKHKLRYINPAIGRLAVVDPGLRLL